MLSVNLPVDVETRVSVPIHAAKSLFQVAATIFAAQPEDLDSPFSLASSDDMSCSGDKRTRKPYFTRFILTGERRIT